MKHKRSNHKNDMLNDTFLSSLECHKKRKKKRLIEYELEDIYDYSSYHMHVNIINSMYENMSWLDKLKLLLNINK